MSVCFFYFFSCEKTRGISSLLWNIDFMLTSLDCERWHDAGTYDAETKTGGPNGSIRNEAEYSHGANSGLKIALDLCGWFFFPSLRITI